MVIVVFLASVVQNRPRTSLISLLFSLEGFLVRDTLEGYGLVSIGMLNLSKNA